MVPGKEKVDGRDSQKEPFLLAVVGKSDTGKTTLILRLIPELSSRGYRVGVVKNCPRGFEIDREGKDSWKFSQAGGQAVLLTSPQRIAATREKKVCTESIPRLIHSFFYDLDVVLIEGHSHLLGISKLELLRKGVSEVPDCSLQGVIARVSDLEVEGDKPVFRPDEGEKIADFVERTMLKKNNQEKVDKVQITVNGEKLPLNFFLKRLVKNLTLAIVEPLKRKDEGQIKEVTIKVNLEKDK